MRSSTKRALKIVLLAVVAYAALRLGFELAKEAVFYPAAPQADYPEPADEREARLQDLDYFRHYLTLDRSYDDEARRRASELVDELAARAGELSDAEFELGVARAVSLAGNGHSNVWGGPRARRLGRLPLRGYHFEEGYTVVRVHRGLEPLLGGRIEAVDGHPIEGVLRAMRPYYGGTEEAYRHYGAATLLEVPSLLHAAGVAEDPRALLLSVAFPGGRRESFRVAAEAPDPEGPRAHPWRLLAPEELEREAGEWAAALPPGALPPLGLRDPDEPFRHFPLPEIGGYYVQYRSNNDERGRSIRDFQRAALAAVRSLRPRVLVLDERYNAGGDYTRTADPIARLVSALPPEATLYILTGPGTFSAGINSVAFARAAAQERGLRSLIAGQRIGDRERSWGETSPLTLPRSGIGMTFSRGLHDVADGCWRLECYWTDFFYNVAPGRLDPDLPVGESWAAYAAGRDPVLEAVFEAESG